MFKIFQVIILLNCHGVISLCVLRSLKVFCLAKYAQDFDVNIELSTWEDAVNAENSKCKIHTECPFNEFYFNGLADNP